MCNRQYQGVWYSTGMFSILHALILGIVEGVTEFLPISSTAHLILTSNLLNIPQTNFQKSFEIFIQLGAILAVVVLYWRYFLQNFTVLKKILVAFIPTGILGLALYSVVKHYLLGNEQVVLWSLLLGGIALIVFEIFHRRPLLPAPDSFGVANISYTHCLVIGTCQALALIPGVSRSAATIIGGLLLGVPRKTIVEFSFLLAVPTMLAATALDVVKSYKDFSLSNVSYLAVGFIASFVVALISIKFLLNFIRRHDFKSFGIYRIAVSLLFFLK